MPVSWMMIGPVSNFLLTLQLHATQKFFRGLRGIMKNSIENMFIVVLHLIFMFFLFI